MARSFDQPTGPNYAITSVGSVASLGNGAHTVIALFQTTASASGNAGLISFRSAGINVQIIVDGGQLFGAGDFNGGQTGITTGTWWWAAIRKAAGTNVYRFSLRQYNTGSTTHQSTVATHADTGATNTSIRLGDGDNRGNGLIAAWAAWTSNLSDAAVAGMFTTAAADIAAQSPQALWLGNQASSTDPIPDSTGNGAGSTSFVGPSGAGVGADPPGYSYTLTTAGVWIPVTRARRLVQPPRRRPRAASPVRAQVNPPIVTPPAKQPRRLRALRSRRGHTFTPVPAQVIVQALAYPPRPVHIRVRGLLLRRGRAAIPMPVQPIPPPAYPQQVPSPRRRGLRPFRSRQAFAPVDQPYLAADAPPRRRGLRLFRTRVAQVAPPQLATPPPYPIQPVCSRVRGLRPARGRAAMAAPAQITPVVPAFVPLAVRTRMKGILRRFARPAAAPAPQNPVPLASHGRPRMVVQRRARAAGPVPPQIVVAPPAYPVRPVRVRLKGLRLMRGKSAAPVPPQVVIIAPKMVPVVARIRRKLAGIFRGSVVTPVAPVCDCSTHRPNLGATVRPSTGMTMRPGSGVTLRPSSGTTTRPASGITSRPCSCGGE